MARGSSSLVGRRQTLRDERRRHGGSEAYAGLEGHRCRGRSRLAAASFGLNYRTHTGTTTLVGLLGRPVYALCLAWGLTLQADTRAKRAVTACQQATSCRTQSAVLGGTILKPCLSRRRRLIDPTGPGSGRCGRRRRTAGGRRGRSRSSRCRRPPSPGRTPPRWC